MTPASGGEVDELLEPLWSWPQRTMPANPIGRGLRPALTPATPTTRARPQAPPPRNLHADLTSSLTRPHSIRDADLDGRGPLSAGNLCPNASCRRRRRPVAR